MGSRQADAVRLGLSKLAAAQAAELTDAQLLHHFAAAGDEEAFAALVRRHGGLVYSVCRNVLRDHHDAQDAFQGTFLVLARKAGAIREQTALASWLYRVAFRVAVRARKAADRRRQKEARAGRPEAAPPSGQLAWQELQAMLDEELNRLPEKYRAPFVLCCLTGLSKSEAAAELGWKEGTVSSRLAQARAMLQGRLARRGVALTAVLSGLAISRGGAAAAVPAGLLDATRRAALAFVGIDSLPAAPAVPVSLARGVLWRMTVNRFKPAVGFLTLLAVAGTAVALTRLPDPEPPPAGELAVAPAPVPDPQPPAPTPAKRMTVGGFVAGPDGTRVPGARVVVVAAQSRRPGDPHPGRHTMQVIGEGRANDRGEYRIAATQTTAENFRLTALATAPGYAPGSRAAEPALIADDEHTLPVFLGRGRAVGVRLLDPAGRPAAGVRVHLVGVFRNAQPGVYAYFDEPPDVGPGWHDPGTTDAAGTVTLRDLAPGTDATLRVRDDRFAPQWVRVRVPPAGGADPVEARLEPVRTLDGRVTGAAGEPLAGARVVVDTGTPGVLAGPVEVRADAAGRFRVRPFPGETLKAYVSPPPDRPYLDMVRQFDWPAGGAVHQIELSPLRGVLVRGTAVEHGTGRRVAGALVKYEARHTNNALFANDPERVRLGVQWQVRNARTGPDGTFALAVPHGVGAVLVKAAEPDYVHVETGTAWLWQGRTGGAPLFPDAVVPLTAAPEDAPHEVTAVLRRGVTVRGRVVGHAGRPAASALLFSPAYIPEGLEMAGHPVRVRDGGFELPGCEPGKPARVWVYDPRLKEGAVAEFTAGAGEPEVRLAPCVGVRLRVIDRARKPLRLQDWGAYILFRPGDDSNEATWKGTLARLSMPARRAHGIDHRPAEAGDGVVVYRDLIPGATYYVTARVGEEIPSILTTFTAPAAGTLDLGDVTMAVPDWLEKGKVELKIMPGKNGP